MHVDRRLLGWGLFLIVVGAIPLLVRGSVLDPGVVREWPSLWPLLLIGWGLGLVLRRTPGALLGSAISVGVLAVMVGGMVATGFGRFPAFGPCGDGDGGTSFGQRSGTLGDSGSVSVEFNCGSLAIGTVDGSDWSVRGRGPSGRGPTLEAALGRVRFAPPDEDFVGFVDAGAAWVIDVPRAPLLDVGVTVNAGEGNVDLTGAHLGRLSVTLNAGSIALNLAAAATVASVNGTVNAGSATLDLPGAVADVNLTLNAGSITVCLPAGSPVRVNWSGALGANNFDAQGLDKVDDQHWMTVGLDPAVDPHLELNVSANAGSFTLDLGGPCND